jgi:CRP-like cAMP-binding protein
MAEPGKDFIVDADTIHRSPLGRELSPAQCDKLSAVVSARGLEQGMFLLEEGHRDDAIHVVTRGELEVVRQTGGGDWITLQVLREGDMAGELGFIDGVEHSAGIRALGNCEVFSLARQDLEQLLTEDPQLVYQVMRAIIRTVHGILRRMNLQYVEMTNYITRQHGRY